MQLQEKLPACPISANYPLPASLLRFLILCTVVSGLHATPDSGHHDQFQRVIAKARELAGKPYTPPESKLPPPLANLDYSSYGNIRFKKNRSLWRKKAQFEVEFFHRGFLYKYPVKVHEIVNGAVRTVAYNTDMFDFSNNQQLRRAAEDAQGFAGFRLHYPINQAGYKDELAVFQGASYFRIVGRDQSYGLSARGLAIDTAVGKIEEFPRFTEFWLVRPAPRDTSVRVFALLDSESVTGAYRFDITPGRETAVDVQVHLFARRDIAKLGVAPVNGMFMWGENSVKTFDDYRPEVHDADGLLHHTSALEWVWRPLVNPGELRVSTLLDQHLKGFGLLQRDRDFTHYLDKELHYQSRPGFWVTPIDGDWGKGAVELVEIPSTNENNDNIVAYWVSKQKGPSPIVVGNSSRHSGRIKL